MLEDRLCRKCGLSLFGLVLCVVASGVGSGMAQGHATCVKSGMHDFRRCTCKGADPEHDSDCPMEIGDASD